MLASTEKLRLTYFNKIKEATSETELEKVHADFLLDFDIKL
jgi:hypothetical protein